ncbi:MAG TPA: hypothetical protein VHU81_02500 [Thermoanaerobaculia bacterium]|jgi:hypothetical protein|nr:hypothetical protein [Thermoanaerobaculia bacterium]
MFDRIVFRIRLVAVLNFALLAFGAFLLGGDALSGYAEGGHYFLGSAGKFVEVSRSVWTYSYVHMISNFVTFGLAVIINGATVVRGLLPKPVDRQG